jgi:hypothetical protein
MEVVVKSLVKETLKTVVPPSSTICRMIPELALEEAVEKVCHEML